MRAAPDTDRQSFEKLLTKHFGDGLIYLPKSANFGILRDAVSRGLVSEEGYLTRKGRSFLANAR